MNEQDAQRNMRNAMNGAPRVVDTGLDSNSAQYELNYVITGFFSGNFRNQKLSHQLKQEQCPLARAFERLQRRSR